ncbi:MAG: 4-hydroxybenzoate octaprenyltransferase [Candidatus Micrarchaeota archaeon]|nr:MAG: 4-hydroxybenzoate octaprenyltransferase [Candidatus Micrarchaeota archaeon]
MEIFKLLKDIADLIRARATIFSLTFTLIGSMLLYIPSLYKLILISIALFTLRAAAMSFNRYFGSDYDKLNPLKRDAANVKVFSKNQILIIFFIFSIVFIAVSYFLNLLAFVLSFIALAIMVIEPYTKIVSKHRHFSVGLIIGLGIIGGYIGAYGRFPLLISIYILLISYMLFAGANDIIATINYGYFDKKIGLKSYAATMKRDKALMIAKIAHSLFLALMLIFAYLLRSYYILIADVISASLIIEEYLALRKGVDNNKIFINYNGLISILFLIAMIITKI